MSTMTLQREGLEHIMDARGPPRVPLNGVVEEGKTLRRGKSLPRLFALARQKSFSRPRKQTAASLTPGRHATNVEEDSRDSVRSAVSTASSIQESGSTQRSSVFTKASAATDTTFEHEDGHAGKEEMTVDDAIDLYSAGFNDDPEYPSPYGQPPTPQWEEQRRSQKIDEAMHDTIAGAMLLPPASARASFTSMQIISGDVVRSSFPDPPPLRKPTLTHDQYGFRKKSREVTIEQYDAWHREYIGPQERRTQKWIAMLQNNALPTKDPARFPAPSTKVQRFVRKGIPPAWRGEAWFFYAGGYVCLQKNSGHYADLVRRAHTSALNANDKEAIERDLHRTFPDNIHFKPDQPQTPSETPIISSLRRLLSAFAIDHPRTGYCQSLNFIAGMLLLFLPEEKAYWMLHIITTIYLPGTHEVSLEGANVDLWVLMQALKDVVPNVWSKVGANEFDSNGTRLPTVSLCTQPWFMSLFIGTLPIESVLRVWDVLFYEGPKTLFRVAVAIFKLGEQEIQAVADPMEIFQVVQGLPRRMLDITALMEMAVVRISLSTKWIEKKRQERRDMYEEERATEKNRRISRNSDTGRRETSVAETLRKESVVRKGQGSLRFRRLRKNTMPSSSSNGFEASPDLPPLPLPLEIQPAAG